MKYTLLDMAQTIMAGMDADEINSISDTTESLQVARIIRSAYFDIIARANLPEQHTLFSLEASTNSSKPTLMTLPTTIRNMKWLRYDCQTSADSDIQMVELFPLPMHDFLDSMYNLRESDDNVRTFSHTIGTSSAVFLYTNDTAPKFYTTYDDGTVIFDSYDSTLEATLQKSKTLAYGLKVVPWEETDTFIPDLDEAQFALLLNEAKSLAFAELKQTQHTTADRNSRRGWTQLQQQKTKIPSLTDFDKLPNFSRIR